VMSDRLVVSTRKGLFKSNAGEVAIGA